MNRLPLEGIRIADFTQVAQGPYATILLAQMGAEVIKVETESRNPAEQRNGPGFSNLNGSKKSIALNLKDARGVEIAKSLVKISDLMIENFATGVIDRLGLGYDELREVKPDIIMLSSQALGQTGPLRNVLGLWAEVQNFSGLSHFTGYKDGRPGLVGAIWADHLTGMLIVYAALAALHHRDNTGEGQYIRVSMAENLLAGIPEAALDYSVNKRDLGRQENQDAVMAPHNAYRCAGFDQWVAIAVSTEEEWKALCHAAGHAEWADDQRFADPLSRWNNQVDLDKLITDWTITRTNYEIMHILQGVGVAAGPVLNVDGLVQDPHLKERGCFIPLGEVEGRPYLQVAHPWRLSDSPQPYYSLAPKLGENTVYVLGELLGMSEGQIAALTSGGVLS